MTNKTNRHKGLTSLLTLLLIFMMTAVMAFATACTDTPDDSSSSGGSSSTTTTTTTDKSTLLNGTFEFYGEDDDITFPYKSSIRWTQSYGYIVNTADKAETSTASSGIIETAGESFTKFQDTAFGGKKIKDYLAESPSNPTELGFSKVSADLELPENATGNRVLMIHNRIKDKPEQGTAQYFYSSGSTLSLAAGEYGKLSVWAKTEGLATEMQTEDMGAYVRVVNKVGSTSASDLYVKSINTNGEWAKFDIYLAANDMATASYTVYLGLGLGSGKVTAEYVEGFAFFDDVTFEKIEKKDYDDAVAGGLTYEHKVFETSPELALNTEKEEVSLVEKGVTYAANVKDDETSYTTTSFAIDHKTALTAVDFGTLNANAIVANDDAYVNETHKTEAAAEKANIGYGNIAATGLEEKVFYGKKEVTKDDGSKENQDVTDQFKAEDKFLYFNYKNSPATYTVTLPEITVSAEQRKLVTFWAKVDVKNLKSTGLTVTLRDKGDGSLAEDNWNETAIISSLAEITTDNNGWKKYSVLINNTDKSVKANGEEGDVIDRIFDLEVTFGPTDKYLTDKNVFPLGYALVGAFSEVNLAEDASSLFTATNTVSLKADVINTASNDNDTYSFNARQAEIEAGKLSQPLSVLTAKDAVTKSGIFNTEYTYTDLASYDLTKLEPVANNAYVQALAIGDKTSYYTGKSTVAANATAKVTVKLAVLNGATAVINVLDRTPKDGQGFDTLTLAKDALQTEKVDNLEIYKGDVLDADVALTHSLTATAENEGKWYTVTFYVNAGTEDINFGVDVSNKDGVGLVVVDSVAVATADTTTFDSLVKAEPVGETNITAKKFHYVTYEYDAATEKLHLDDDDNLIYTAVYDQGLVYESTIVESNVATAYNLYVSFLSTNFKTQSFVEITDDSDASTDEEGEETETPDAGAAGGEVAWLTISSIIIAAVLLLALIAVIVRHFFKKNSSKKAKTASLYDRDARERSFERIRANKAKRAAELAAEEATEETADDEDEILEEDAYDYDAAINVVEEGEEAPAEETEEAVEETAEGEALADEPAEAPVEETTDAPADEEKPDETV